MSLQAFSIFETLAREVRPVVKYGVILLQERSAQVNARLAMDVLHDLNAGEVNIKFLRQEFPAVLQIHLPPGSLHEAILNLTAKGFTTLKAIDPLQPGRKSS